ncbi:unnamed protein product [Rhizoctonia solani]|uniref:Uncharacterized protein n=1 Tax=Rhizoctonia solani TaxID=456999 RepID=A0A8H2XUJ4_9AGAM|nr:unnamed protein product [Rhizoctonia solani]
MIDLYRMWGGKFGTFDPHVLDDLFHAQQSIFHYLMPGPICIWIAGMDEDVSILFFIGQPNRPIHKTVDLDLAEWCLAMFGGPPCPFTLVEDTGGYIYVMKLKGKLYKVDLIEFMQSNTKGDQYPVMLDNILPKQLHLLGL